MIVLEESASAQTINFIPRQFVSGDSYNVTIINETTNTEVYNVDTTAITEHLYHNQFSAVFPVKQDITYTIKVTGSEVVYKDKIFCTNQSDVTSYSVNENAYIFNDTDNEFITV
tara:strand:+ start:317 stop:658 length:342 start_codon:yes stop_codon:yes gene_type:complete